MDCTRFSLKAIDLGLIINNIIKINNIRFYGNML